MCGRIGGQRGKLVANASADTNILPTTPALLTDLRGVPPAPTLHTPTKEPASSCSGSARCSYLTSTTTLIAPADRVRGGRAAYRRSPIDSESPTPTANVGKRVSACTPSGYTQKLTSGPFFLFKEVSGEQSVGTPGEETRSRISQYQSYRFEVSLGNPVCVERNWGIHSCSKFLLDLLNARKVWFSLYARWRVA